MTTPPPIETLTEFEITADLRRIIDTAYVPNDNPFILAYVGPDDAAHVSFRGSTHVHSDSAIAVWARDPQGGLPGAIAHNPNVTLIYREPNPEGGRSLAVINIRGRGRLSANETERRKVYETMPEVERVPDPEMKGVAVIIEIESITGFIPGYILQMRR